MTGLTKSEQELINGIHEIVSAISGLRIALEEFELSVRTSRYEEQERQARVEREEQELRDEKSLRNQRHNTNDFQPGDSVIIATGRLQGQSALVTRTRGNRVFFTVEGTGESTYRIRRNLIRTARASARIPVTPRTTKSKSK